MNVSMKSIILLTTLSLCSFAFSQVGINTTAPHASSMLDITSTNKGFLMPRMTTSQRGAIASPAEGLKVFDTTTKSFWYYATGAWRELQGSKWTNNTTNTRVQLTNLSNGTARPAGTEFLINDNGSVGIGINNTNASLGTRGAIQLGVIGGSFVGLPFAGPSTNNPSLWFGTYNNTPVDDYGVIYFETNAGNSSTLNILSGDNSNEGPPITNDAVFIGNVSHFNSIKSGITVYNGNLGINTSTPNAPLQFSNSVVNRKIVLYDSSNNDNQFYGFGINSGTLRYQTSSSGADHVFFSGIDASSSSELLRIKGNGNVGIGTATPSQRLDVSGNFRLSGAFMPNNVAGTSGQVLTSGGAGLPPTWTNAASLFTATNIYNSNGTLSGNRTVTQGANSLTFTGTGNTILNSGNVGVGTINPLYSLDAVGGFVHLGTNLSGQIPPSDTANIGLIVGGNRSGGLAEVNLYNSFNNAGTSFQFSQKNSATTYTDLVTLKGNGSVGIGITNPTQRLDVQGGNARINNAFIGDVGHGGGWAGFSHSQQNSTSGYALLQSTDGANTLINKANTGNGVIGFRVGNADQMVITNNGNVGIGNTNPGVKLQVNGITQVDVGAGLGRIILGTPSGQTGLILYSQSSTNGSNQYRANVIKENDNLVFTNSGLTYSTAARMVIDENGNVGVRTTNPTSTFHNNGTTAFATGNAASVATSTVLFAASGTINLPTAATCPGRVYIVRNTTTSGASVFVNNIIDVMSATPAAYEILDYVGSAMFCSNGSNWYVLLQY